VIADSGNGREFFWHLDGMDLVFLRIDHCAGRSRFLLAQDEPMLFYGASVGLSNGFYLREAIALDSCRPWQGTDRSWPTVIVNTTPKSGTY
jgi:hypothetical protein